MRSHRRRGPLEHVLIAGDVQELTAIQSLLLLLPGSVYGQVFVETPAGAPVPTLSAPPRVTVTQLERDPAAATGDQLIAAVQAWLAEWTPEQPDPDRVFTVWAGASTRRWVYLEGATLESL